MTERLDVTERLDATPDLAALAASAARAAENCRLCARECGVNRHHGRVGFCRLDLEAPCYKALLSHGEEPELSPTALLALGGCSLRCLGCPEWDHVVEPWRAPAVPLRADWLAARLTRWIAGGARTLSFVGGEPTVHLPAVLKTLAELPPSLRLPVVWNTNGVLGPGAFALLRDVVACWVVDYKVVDDGAARRLLGAGSLAYVAEVEATLDRIEAAATPSAAGSPGGDGLPRLLIRHLLVPGELERSTLPLLERLSQRWPSAVVNLMLMWLPHGPALSAAAGPTALRRVNLDAERAIAIAEATRLLGPRLRLDGKRIA